MVDAGSGGAVSDYRGSRRASKRGSISISTARARMRRSTETALTGALPCKILVEGASSSFFYGSKVPKYEVSRQGSLGADTLYLGSWALES